MLMTLKQHNNGLTLLILCGHPSVRNRQLADPGFCVLCFAKRARIAPFILRTFGLTADDWL